MSSPNVSLTAAAVLDVNTHHQTHGTVYDTVTNRGVTAITVTAKVANLNATAQAHPASQWLSLPETSFTIQPHSAVSVPIVLNVPVNAVGETQVSFTAAPVASGTLKVSGAVATSVEINNPPQVADQAAKPVKLAKPPASQTVHNSNGLTVTRPSSGVPVAAIVGLSAVIVVAALVAIFYRRLRPKGSTGNRSG